MPTRTILSLVALSFLTSCSPRDFLSRRLAADLIAASEPFKTPQRYLLQTGILSNKDHASPESLTLQHHGWITASTVTCPPNLTPSPCWDTLLTPSGVDTVRTLLSPEEAAKASLAIPVARRDLVAITGISREGISAEVEFTWRWIPLNEIGAALYSSNLQYRSTVGFRDYDDGWRVVLTAPHPAQTLDDALKSADPVQ